MSGTLRNKARAVFGVAARYETPQDLLAAVDDAKHQGYRMIEVYSPFPVEGLPEVLHLSERPIPWLMLAGGFAGCVGGFMMQYGSSVWWISLNIGGRPLNSWPAFIPITFELTILTAALAGFFTFVTRCGLPEIYHPAFDIPEFERATLDSFFLCILSSDARFKADEVTEFLRGTRAKAVHPVGEE